MIDPLLSLAFGMHSVKGAYALLLGSGVSRSARIPTGWEVVLDLIRKVALLSGQDCQPDPAAWYKATFGEMPAYDTLLDQLAHSPSERNGLLKGYFEPSEDEREQGIKLPTAAHKAIAEMVAGGFVRVIVTTNFDRLTEQALEAIGIHPTVIASPDAVQGALPLVHTQCTLIKVHGDYLDTRIKNSPEELAAYDTRLDGLLDRVFDEFGLIVCGWSAEWDTALRRAIERCPNHRFTTFWAARGDVQAKAKDLIALRRAQVIAINDADSFFKQLAEKTLALADVDRPHPLSAKIAVSSLKRYLSDDRYRIDLHDLVMREIESVAVRLAEPVWNADERWADNNDLKGRLLHRVQQYEANTEALEALFVTGCYWGEGRHEQLWVRLLERIANPPGSHNGLTLWINLRRYPALRLLYVGGIAAVAAGKYGTLATLLTKPVAKDLDERKPLVTQVNTWAVMEKQVGQQLPDLERHFAPLSDYLFTHLREPLRGVVDGDEQYQACFDRFEYLLGMVYADLEDDKYDLGRGPVGCFGWRYRRWLPERSLAGQIEAEAHEAGEAWPPLQAGLFAGSLDRFLKVKKAFDEFVAKLPWF